MQRRAGFTLLEVVLAIAIALVVMALAVPSVRGVFREQRLQRTALAFDDLVQTAQSRAVNERRAYGLVWKKGEIDLTPLEQTEDQPAQPERIPIGEGQSYDLERTAAMVKDPPAIWTFWRSGACEPAKITYQGPEGSWVATYDPLTARRSSFNEVLP